MHEFKQQHATCVVMPKQARETYQGSQESGVMRLYIKCTCKIHIFLKKVDHKNKPVGQAFDPAVKRDIWMPASLDGLALTPVSTFPLCLLAVPMPHVAGFLPTMWAVNWEMEFLSMYLLSSHVSAFQIININK